MNRDEKTTLSLIQFSEKNVDAKSLLDLLRRLGNIQDVAREIIMHEALSSVIIDQEEEGQIMADFRKEQSIEDEESYLEFMRLRHLNEKLLFQMVTKPTRAIRYREERWGPQIRSLYLKHKDKYDLVLYRKIQATSQNYDIMQEIYFRLKEREESWDSLGMQIYGNPNTKTMIGPISAGRIEPPILDMLKQLGPKKVSQPFLVGSNVVLIELEDFQTRELDDEMKAELLQAEFDAWLNEECNRILKEVTFQE